MVEQRKPNGKPVLKSLYVRGMSDNKMYVAQRSNLYFGTGLLNSTQEVKVLDMSDLDASNNVRMVMRFTSAVQFGIAADLVEYA